jgi:ketosteroid isomerase-like protein
VLLLAADTSADKQSLLAADRALAVGVRTYGHAFILNVLDPDAAVIMPYQDILPGRNAVMQLHQRYDDPSIYTWQPTHAVVSADGKFGCTVGYTTYQDYRDRSMGVSFGRYISCWRKAYNGVWKLVARQTSDSQVSYNDTKATIDTLRDDGTLPRSATVSLTADAKQVRKDILAREAEFAAAGRSGTPSPAEAFAAFAAPDAILLSGAQVARGKDQIRAAFKDWPANVVLDWNPDLKYGAGSGGLAYTTGNSQTYERGDTTNIKHRGHFMTVWRQDADGKWYYIFDLGSPRPAK